MRNLLARSSFKVILNKTHLLRVKVFLELPYVEKYYTLTYEDWYPT